MITKSYSHLFCHVYDRYEIKLNNILMKAAISISRDALDTGQMLGS